MSDLTSPSTEISGTGGVGAEVLFSFTTSQQNLAQTILSFTASGLSCPVTYTDYGDPSNGYYWTTDNWNVIPAGTSGTINSVDGSCTLNAAHSSATVGANSTTFVVALTFNTSATWGITVQNVDNDGNSYPVENAGSWSDGNQSFSLSFTPSSPITLQPGGSIPIVVSATGYFGFSSPITLSIAGLSFTAAGQPWYALPPGVTISPTPTTILPGQTKNFTLSAAATAPPTGTFSYLTYQGTAGSVSSGNLFPLTVTAPTLTNVTAQSLGSQVTLTAIVSSPTGAGTPIGTATFFDGSNNAGTVTVSGGVATLGLPSELAGAHSFSAQFAGAAGWLGSSSPTLSYNVTPDLGDVQFNDITGVPLAASGLVGTETRFSFTTGITNVSEMLLTFKDTTYPQNIVYCTMRYIADPVSPSFVAVTSWQSVIAGQPGIINDGNCSLNGAHSSITFGASYQTITMALIGNYADNWSTTFQAADSNAYWYPVEGAGGWSVWPPSPYFTLSTGSQSSLRVQAGSTASLAVIATPQNGFSDELVWSASNLPSGVTVTASQSYFNPGPGGITLNVTASASAPAADSAITITVSDAGFGPSQAIQIPIAVTPAATNPTTLSLTQSSASFGSPAVTFTAQVQPSGAVGTIAFYDSYYYSGTVALSSVTVPSNGIAMWNANLGVGSHNVWAVFNGTWPWYSAISTAVSVTVTGTQPPDFTLSAPAPATITLYPTGAPSSSFVEEIGGGFTGAFTFSYTVSPTPSIGSIAFTPTTAASAGAITVTGGASLGTPAGNYTLTMVATGTRPDGSSTSHQIQVPIVVSGPPSLILSSPLPSPVTIWPNSSTGAPPAVTFGLTVTSVNGLTGIVGFEVPATQVNQSCWGIGVNGNISVPSVTLSPTVTSQTVTATLTADPYRTASPNNSAFPCELDAVIPGAGTVSFAVPVLVFPPGVTTPPSSFSITGVPTSQLTLYGTASTSFQVTLNSLNGYSGNVSFTSGTAGFSVSGSATLTAGGTATAQVTIQSGSPTPTPSPISVTVKANGQSLLTIPVVIQSGSPNTFSLTVSPASQTADANGLAVFQVNVNPSGTFTGTVALQVNGLLAGLSTLTKPSVVSPGVSTLLVKVPATSATTLYRLTVVGSSGTNVASSQSVFLTVNPSVNVPATMIWPLNGSTVVAGRPFKWKPGVGVSTYRLTVGTAKSGDNSHNLYDQSFPASSCPTSPCTATPTVIPNDGSTFFVNLYSTIGGQVIADPGSGGGCGGGDGGGGGGGGTPPVPPTFAISNSAAVVLNNGQQVTYSYSVRPENATQGTIDWCGTSDSSDPLQVGLSTISSLSHGPFSIGYIAKDNVTPGNHPISCHWYDPLDRTHEVYFDVFDSNLDGAHVYDATPMITNAGTLKVLYAGDQGGVTLKVSGQNFGKSGHLVLCLTGSTCNGSNTSGTSDDGHLALSDVKWGTDVITATLTADQNAANSYEVMVVSGGANGGGNGFFAQAGASQTKPNSPQEPAARPNQPMMKLSLQPGGFSIGGPPLYAEQYEVRVVAVGEDGMQLTSWLGKVGLQSESGATTGVLLGEGEVSLMHGSSTFVAKTVSSTTDGTVPPDGLVTTSYGSVGGPLHLPQWVTTDTEDPLRALPGTPDWVAARARDILDNASGETAEILSHVAAYGIYYPGSGSGAGGQTTAAAADKSIIYLNPYNGSMRTDLESGQGCGNATPTVFTTILLHEGRHTYQNSLKLNNDADGDGLIALMPPGKPNASSIIDSNSVRTVCDASSATLYLPGHTYSTGFKGDSTPDPFDPPAQPISGFYGYVRWALEQDAYSWAAAILGY